MMGLIVCLGAAGGWSLVLSVVGGLHLDRGDVAAVFVEAVVVEPGDPPGSGVFDLLDGPPGLAWFDQLGLVQAVDGFGVHTPRQRSPRPGRLEDSGGQVPIEAAGAQRPPQQAADRPDDVSTSNNAVRASTLSDVRVDERRVQTPPLHRPVSRRQHVQKAGR